MFLGSSVTKDYKGEGVDPEDGILTDLSYQVKVLPQVVKEAGTAVTLQPPNLWAS